MLPQIDDFLLNLKVNNLSPETIYNYSRDLQVFQDFLDEIKIDFSNIDKKTILNYKAYLISIDRRTSKNHLAVKKLVSFSINRMLSAIRSYLKFLIDMGYHAPISPSEIKLVKTEKKQARISELSDIIKLIESPTQFEPSKIVALRNRAILETIFSTGMRISEALNLRKEQIDKTGRIYIRGKGKKERFVYLTPRAHSHIKEYLDKKGIDDSIYLFIPTKGRSIHDKDKKISPNYLEMKVKKYRELLGLNIPISPHSLRHAFATYLAENGANPAAIQILLGHESLDTTTRYVHASDQYAEKTHRQFHPLKDKD